MGYDKHARSGDLSNPLAGGILYKIFTLKCLDLIRGNCYYCLLPRLVFIKSLGTDPSDDDAE